MFNKKIFSVLASVKFSASVKESLKDACKDLTSAQKAARAAESIRKISILYKKAETLQASPFSGIGRMLITEKEILKMIS